MEGGIVLIEKNIFIKDDFAISWCDIDNKYSSYIVICNLISLK